jgi:hypothetical protein
MGAATFLLSDASKYIYHRCQYPRWRWLHTDLKLCLPALLNSKTNLGDVLRFRLDIAFFI